VCTWYVYAVTLQSRVKEEYLGAHAVEGAASETLIVLAAALTVASISTSHRLRTLILHAKVCSVNPVPHLNTATTLDCSAREVAAGSAQA
jgi:hypothetical protein